MIKVSIIVPVYNVEKYINRCLDSLVNQTLKEIEIIVVNDESPDNSEEIIIEYQKKYNNIKYYKKTNGGLSDARNYGIKYASGEYIGFVDSDDYVDLSMFEKLYEKAFKENLDIVVCDSIEVYNDKTILKKSNFNYSDSVIKNYIISPPMACTRLYKKYIFDQVKFTKNIFYEDLYLNPGLINITKKIGFLNEGLYFYIQRSGSIMKQKKYDSKLLDIFKVLKHNKDVLNDKYPNEIEYLYISHLLRTASLRFLDYDNYKELISLINKEIRNEVPNYHKNIYYQKSSYKLKIICFLAYHKQYNLLKLIKKIGG